MYLKKLDICGFKSFADRVSLSFSDGITTVIGPNGSGKSNIVDAMKWVLGEQSVKSLRGLMMEDVLYKGNENRRAGNIASVSITLRNENRFLPIDFNEVSITRKLYRDGESEYLINNNPTRLKDIIDLIADSGISKSGYSILSQGEIDIILKNNPVERRIIFEEAAGIIRFKNRKKAALSKLKSVDEDLVRLKDILLEKEKYLSSLSRQVSKARRYKELREDLIKKVEGAYKYELKKLKEDIIKKEEILKSLQEQRIQLETSITIVEANIEIQKEFLSQIRDELYFQKQNVDKTNQILQQLEIELNNLKNKKDNNILQINRLKRVMQDNLLKIEEIKKNIADLKEEESKLLKDKETAESQLLSSKEKFQMKKSEVENYKSEFSVIQTEYDNLKSSEIKLEQEINYLKKDIENNKSQKNELKDILNNKEEYIKELRNKSAEISDNKKGVEEYILNLNNSIDKTKMEIFQLKKEYESFLNEVNKLQREANQISGQLKLLEELNNSFEGYLKGVKHFLKDKKNDNLKLLTDVLEVSETYESIIENYLNDKLQILILENLNNFEKYLTDIETNKLSNVYFFISSKFENKSVPANFIDILKEDGVICFARDAIKTNDRYSDFINHILRNVVIVEKINDALNISKKYNEATFLTLNGDIYENGILIVNKNSDNTGLIKRKRETKEYKIKFERLQNELQIISLRINNINNEINNKEFEIKKLNDKFQEKNLYLRDLTNDEKSLKNELQKTGTDIENYENKLNWFAQKEKEQLTKLEEKSTEFESVKIRQNEVRELYEEKEKSISDNEAELSLLNEEYYNSSINFNNYQSQLVSLNSKLKLYNEQIESLKKSNEKNNAEIEELKLDSSKIEERMNSNSGKINETISNRNLLQEIVKKIYNNEKIQQQKLDELFIIKDNNNSKLKLLNDEIHLQELTLNETNNSINSLKMIAKEKYTLEVQELISDDEIEYDETVLEDLKNEIKRIEEKISNIGAVNIDAIQEYEELKKEFDFITKQKEDLEKAESDLKELIKKIDKESKEKFIETFEKAKENFSKIIAKIFVGGEGELKLLDEEDVLETGIDIIVRMPGKRFQTISLLSGGEKTMVSIALLFSLFEIKPSPFCILDEIDAALDDANILRFIQLVKDFQKYTQFIIITHNKLTMEMSDTIYGVTMEEVGISKILSFKLENKKDNEKELVAN